MAIDYQARIPNNVDLASDRRPRSGNPTATASTGHRLRRLGSGRRRRSSRRRSRLCLRLPLTCLPPRLRLQGDDQQKQRDHRD